MTAYEQTEIRKEAIPAWYKLSLEDDNVLIISVHQSWYEKLREQLDAQRLIVKEFLAELSLEPFQPPTEPNWGFGSIMKKIESSSQFLRWQVDIPRVEKKSLSHYDWRVAYNITATLNVLFMFLTSIRTSTQCPSSEPQLVECFLRTRVGSCRDSITVTLGKPLVDWIRHAFTISQGKESYDILPVREAMTNAYSQMYPSCKSYDYDCQVWYRPPCYIFLQVPGNACDISPNIKSYDSKLGYELHPHNVDSPIQQIAFLVGIARLCDLYREDQ